MFDRASGHAKMVQDLQRDVARRPKLCVQQNVGAPIGGGSLSKHFADLLQRLWVAEQGAMILIFHSRPNCLRRSPEANDKRMLLQAFHVFRIDNEAASCSDHRSPPSFKLVNDFSLKLAKRRFPVIGEDL